LGYKDVSIFYESLVRESVLIVYKSRNSRLRIQGSARERRRKE